MLIHGLSPDAAEVNQARTRIMQSGKYGVVSVEQLQGATLPYAANMVNLLIVSDPTLVPRAEILRVLSPLGVVMLKSIFLALFFGSLAYSSYQILQQYGGGRW